MPARITTTIGRTTFPVLTVGEESVSELNTEGKFTRMREVSIGFTPVTHLLDLLLMVKMILMMIN